MTKVVINIFEKSFLIANGLKSLLNELYNFNIETKINDIDNLEFILEQAESSIIILNTELYNSSIIKLIAKLKPDNKIILIGLRNSSNNIETDNFDDYIDYNEEKNDIKNKINKHLESLKIKKSNNKPDNELSKREKSILELLAKGNTSKEVAEKLFISVHTVITHRKNIAKKLDIRTLSGLTVYAILNRIVDMNDLNQN